MRFPALAVFLLSAASLAAAQTTPPAGAPWDYEGKRGTLTWGKLDPAYKACSQGHEQSPVDIRGARLNKALQPIEFHYISSPVTLENNGHTVIVHVGPGSYIVANGVRYDLVQFHFHHPAEEAVKGKLTDMDVHLVHKSADGKQAVIAIRLVEDRGDAVDRFVGLHVAVEALGRAHAGGQCQSQYCDECLHVLRPVLCCAAARHDPPARATRTPYAAEVCAGKVGRLEIWTNGAMGKTPQR